MMGVSQYSVVWFTTLIAIEQAGQISPLLEPTDQFPWKSNRRSAVRIIQVLVVTIL